MSIAGHCQGHAEGAGGPASSAGSAPMVGMSLKDQLDAIPTPSKVANSTPGSLAGGVSSRATGQNLGAVGAPFSGGGPRASTSRAPQMSAGGEPTAAAATGAGAAPSQQTGEVPQWMRNFQDHQSSIMPASGSSVSAGAQSPASYGSGTPSATPSYNSAGSGYEPPAQGSGYAVMIGSVIFICVIMFVYMMMNKPQASPVTAPTSSSSSVSESGAGSMNQLNGSNTLPSGQGNVQMPASNFQTSSPTVPTAAPDAQSYQQSLSPNPVPGTPPNDGLSPNPVPEAASPSPNPVPGITPGAPNPVPGITPGAPNPVPGITPGAPNPVPMQVPATNP